MSLLAAALLLVGVCGAAGAEDLVQQIVSRLPASPHNYGQMLAKLASLERSDRVTLTRLGRTHGGREIVCVALHGPNTVFGQGRRLFVVARQHGNEVSGTEALLALIHQLAVSPGELERATLDRLTIIAVPMANPDGADVGRRDNSRGVDLNRDWATRSQSETAAIERAVRVWKPHALLDLHELPQSTPKPAYADNFIETIGEGGSIPANLSAMTGAVALDMADWMKSYSLASSVYYDGPGRDRRLCHRHFGLDLGIPSFLLEAKTGPGRTLARRVAFHTLGILVAASHLMASDPTGGPPRTTPPTLVAGAPAQPQGGQESRVPVCVKITSGPTIKDPEGTTAEVETSVAGAERVRYLKYYLDGQLYLVSNTAPYRCEFDSAELEDGGHQIRIDAVGAGGKVLAQCMRQFTVDNSALAGR